MLSVFNDDHPAGITTTTMVHVIEQSTHYAAQNSLNPVFPYLSWATAATNLQDAVDATVAGGTVVVSNGLYITGTRDVAGTPNRLAVPIPLTVQSINGPDFTVLDGGGSNRCVYLTKGAAIIGFTLTNGTAGGGGGVWAESRSAIISNCVIRGNSAGDGGGAARGTLIDCVLSGNIATLGSGGGANGSALECCTVSGNRAGFVGGGVIGCLLSNCVVSGNTVNDFRGAGVVNSTVNNSLIVGNWAIGFNAAGGGACSSVLNNCVVAGNRANQAGGTLFGALNNCTVVGNTADFSSSSGGGCWGGTLNNCIVYFNNGGNYTADSLGISVNFCSTTPLPGGPGNITNAPIFVNQVGGDYRLQTNSPGINGGSNPYAPTGPDFDGNLRIAGGSVDMGAYEFQSPSSMLSYAWAQQFGLPIDGSADFADPDGDTMNNVSEWRSDTNPTNAASVLRILSATNGPSGRSIMWQCVATRSYWLERATNLGSPSPFQIVATNISGAAGTKTHADPSATNAGPYFYRVGVY